MRTLTSAAKNPVKASTPMLPSDDEPQHLPAVVAQRVTDGPHCLDDEPADVPDAVEEPGG
jgi:hypothetical protein